jgi:hypothetical protein
MTSTHITHHAPHSPPIVLQAGLVSNMVVLHTSMLSMGATPRQYMAFVQLYNSILSEKRKQVGYGLLPPLMATA